MEQFSIPSTACSTPTTDSVEKIIKNDTIRYKRKGYGLISATLIAISFFYLFPQLLKAILPKLIAKWTVPQLYIMMSIFVHSVTTFLANFVLYLIYTAKIEFFERYRVLTNPWPWESDPEKWKIVLKKTIKNNLFSHFVIIPTILVLDTLVGVKIRFDMESFPEYKEILAQLIFFMICEDFLFYWSHRALHHPKIYPIIHKQHHEYNITVSIAAEYSHPLEFVIANVIPTAAGIKLLGNRVHVATYITWTVIRIMETVDGHSGYEFSWSPYRLLPLSGSSSYHNFHHYQNVGNYASFFTIWDSICGTNKAYFRYLAKKEKAELAAKLKGEYERMREKQRNDPNHIRARQLEKQELSNRDSSPDKATKSSKQKVQ